jgi:hypothetical protein
MKWLLGVVTLCAVGLTACGSVGPAADESNDPLTSAEQGLACEIESGYCPSNTVCAWRDYPIEGLCRSACVNGACPIAGQLCCTQPNGAPYCNSFCF